jgi:integrase
MPRPSDKLYLTKRSNGYYYVGYFLDGRKHWKTTKAKLKVDALKAISQLTELLKAKPKPTTLSAFTADFLSYASNIYASKTREMYFNALKRFERQFGDIRLSEISAKHLDDYIAHRLRPSKPGAHRISPVSVNIELRALRAAMTVAVRWSLLPSNPFRGMRQLRCPEVPPTYFTKSDIQKLLSVISEEWLRDIIVFAALTGMRRGEVLNLRWENIDLKRRMISIQSGVTFTTKQGKRRVLPMSEILYSMLVAKVGQSSCAYVFHLQGQQLRNDQATKGLKKYVKLAGLNARLHFHSLRHTFASWLVQDGASLYEVQKLLGHSNISVTQVYAHLLPESLHGTVNRLNIDPVLPPE